MKDKERVYTSDFLTATIFLYFKEELKELNKKDPSRIIFCFLKNETTDKTLELLHKGKLKVEPKKLAYIQRSLKNRMFS